MNTARKRNDAALPVHQEIGTVVLIEASADAVGRPRALCRTARGEVWARRAVACLVAPRIEDRVLVATDGAESWVLSVLEREATDVDLAVEGDLRLTAGQGRVAIAARDGLDLATGGDLGITGARVDLGAEEVRASVGTLDWVGDAVVARLDRIRSFARLVDSEAERLTQRARNAIRAVKELDLVRAERVEIAATEDARVRGKHAMVYAEKLVKVDGDQIHVG